MVSTPSAALLDAGRERERDAVEDEVGRLDAVALDREVVDAARDRELPVGGARLALFVDGQADDRGAVLARERHHAVDALARLLALFEVGGVEDRLAAECWSPASRTGGSVESNTSGSPAWVAKRLAISCHVDGAVAADVVDADVEHVRAFLHLLAGHLHARVPVGVEHRVAELLRAVRVRALADGEVRDVLVERNVRVDRRAAGLELHVRATGARVPTRSTTARRCAGVVPQQPPTMLRPNSLTKRSCASASTSGVRS